MRWSGIIFACRSGTKVQIAGMSIFSRNEHVSKSEVNIIFQNFRPLFFPIVKVKAKSPLKKAILGL